MRVETIISINAHQKKKPHTTDYAGLSNGKTASGKAFEDYLRANMEKVSTPVVSRHTENQLAGLLMGYYAPLKITQKEEPKTESNAS